MFTFPRLFLVLDVISTLPTTKKSSVEYVFNSGKNLDDTAVRK